MDFVTIENPNTGVDVNILVITNHFTRYAKAIITSNQTAKATAITFGTNSSQITIFLKKLLTDQGQNFESKLITELCKLTNIQNVQTTLCHPETNGQCKRFNQTLISMIGTSETDMSGSEG